MIKNYFVVAIRNLRDQKMYSLINILGLAVGITCFLIISLYVQYELSYDRFHEKSNQIFQINWEFKNDTGEQSRSAITPSGCAPVFMREFPEVIHAVRVYLYSKLLKYGEKRLRSSGFYYVDPSFLKVFSFPMIQGDPATALRDPFSIVLTDRAARRAFGNENPLGKVLLYDNKFQFKVTGVVENPPSNSHLQFSYLATFASLKEVLGRADALDEFVNWNYYTYLLLPKGYAPENLEKKFAVSREKHSDDQWRNNELRLQPITDIHFDTETNYSFGPKTDIRHIYTFLTIAVSVLLIACINFVNLSTARSSKRAREVGLRKVFGAHRWHLIRQFLGEAILLSFAALVMALALSELLLPHFNALSGQNVMFRYLDNVDLFLKLLCTGLVVGIIAGSYPAFYLSSFQPTTVLKGIAHLHTRGTSFRQILIVLQFAITIVLIIGTVTVFRQFQFMRTQNLGFEKERVVFFGRNRDINAHYTVFKQKLLQNPNILSVASASALPGRVTTSRGYFWEKNKAVSFYSLMGDPDLVKTLDMELVAGRNMSWDIESDNTQAYLLNEAAVKELGWTDAVGKPFRVWDQQEMGQVVGVVRDFNFKSLHHKIEPLVIHQKPAWYGMIAVKITDRDISGTLTYAREAWEQITSTYSFSANFLDSDFERLYRAEERLGRILTSFSLLAIFVACIGLFGLVSFAAEQRNKEIGIRKVMGASVPDILRLVSREFVKLVVIANLIAWPIAYYAMENWLKNFAYRIGLDVWPFALGGLLALFIALITVSYQAWEAAHRNPVDALRDE